MDNKSSHFHTKTYLGEGRYKHRSFGDVDLVIPTTYQKTISFSNCDHYYNMEEDESNRGNLKFGTKDNGTCDVLGDFSMDNINIVTTVTDNNSYKEVVQFVAGDNISEFEWIFKKLPSSGETTVSNFGNTYLDMESDGGFWLLLAYANEGNLGAELTNNYGSYSSSREGQFQINVLDIIGDATEMAFAWTTDGSYPNGKISDYQFAFKFNLLDPLNMTFNKNADPPFGYDSTNFSLVATGEAKNKIARVELTSIGINNIIDDSNLDDFPGSTQSLFPKNMYYRKHSFGVNYGLHYGLVNSDGNQNALDWTPDSQEFRVVYFKNGENARLVANPGGISNSFTPTTFSIWIKILNTELINRIMN